MFGQPLSERPDLEDLVGSHTAPLPAHPHGLQASGWGQPFCEAVTTEPGCSQQTVHLSTSPGSWWPRHPMPQAHSPAPKAPRPSPPHQTAPGVSGQGACAARHGRGLWGAPQGKGGQSSWEACRSSGLGAGGHRVGAAPGGPEQTAGQSAGEPTCPSGPAQEHG